MFPFVSLPKLVVCSTYEPDKPSTRLRIKRNINNDALKLLCGDVNSKSKYGGTTALYGNITMGDNIDLEYAKFRDMFEDLPSAIQRDDEDARVAFDKEYARVARFICEVVLSS